MLFNRRLEAGVNDGTVCLYDGFPSVQVAKTVRRLLEADCTPDTHVFACGPVGFMDIVVEHSLLRLPPANVHIERFQPLPEAKAETKPFEVVLARSGVTCRVGAGETILEALAKHSVKVDASCREGICGACLTRVLQGAPDHRDSFMTEGERLANEDICLCVSRSLTPSLVLDL
jgi:vanillate O-demethylase ferredoxin subunit